jgi:hypothetical protein
LTVIRKFVERSVGAQPGDPEKLGDALVND